MKAAYIDAPGPAAAIRYGEIPQLEQQVNDATKRLEYTATADEWLKKAVELRKKSQPKPQQTPAKT